MAAARRTPGAPQIGRLIKRMFDADLRAVHRVRATPGAFQPWPQTGENRYPQLFDALAQRLAPLPAPRILSFGCSTGEEVRALRRRLPHARITGIDINPRAIAKARAADDHPLSGYRHAAAPDPADRFDAVLALAVLRHGDLEAFQPDDCSAIMPFARFAEGVAMLDACLADGGWLAVFNAHFRFCDTPLAARYAADPFRMTDANTPPDVIWGADNRRIHGQPYAQVLFRKLPPS